MGESRAAVRLTRRYDASPAEVWSALTDPDRLAGWLGRVRRGRMAVGEQLELEVGARTIPTTVRRIEPQRTLELDWQPRGEQASVVRFELRPHGQGTLLVLDHSRLDERACIRYGGAWTAAVGRLDDLFAEVTV
jgi:uncharacterized protein YndB with AHSA1/START domain